MEMLNEEKLFELTNTLSKQFFKKPFMHQVVYNYRLRTTGGRYIPAKKTIEINPKYVMEMDKDECIGIIKHELCHYHLHIAGKGFKHGDKEFKQLLKATGAPRHCKALPSSENKYKHQYICRSCERVYLRVRQVNVNKYKCGKCKGHIYLAKSFH